MTSYYSFIGNSSRFIYIKCFSCEKETSTSIYFAMYVIVVIPDDGRYKRLKIVVEDKWLLSVESITFVYKFSIQVDYELFYWRCISCAVLLSHAKKLHIHRNCFLSSFSIEQFNNAADEH